jgi:hypothetical protein
MYIHCRKYKTNVSDHIVEKDNLIEEYHLMEYDAV